MMENLSPEIWTTNDLLHRETSASSGRLHKEEAEAPPREREVLREIALVLAAHIVTVTVIVMALHWLGIQ
jgi:hypothetical protein